jgi:hypothetical protein
MSDTSGASQDLLVRRLLAAFQRPIDNAQKHPDRDKIFKHLKNLCPDQGVPLLKKHQDTFNKLPILKAWEKDDPKAFNKAIDDLLKTYPLPDDLHDLARKLQAFQDDYEPLDCSELIATAIEEIAAKYPDRLDFPAEWADDDYAGANAALTEFKVKYKGKGTSPPGGDPPGGDPPGGDPPGGDPPGGDPPGGDPPGGDPPGGDPPGGDPPRDDLGDDAPEKLWPRFTALVNNGTIKKDSHRWLKTKTTCGLVGCDWADMKFYLEFELKGKAGAVTDTDVYNDATDFERKCPEILNHMEKDFWGDGDMHKIYRAYRDRHPRQVQSRDSRSGGARRSKTPALDRIQILNIPIRPKVIEDFDKIYVNDPDQGGKRVEGTIVYAFDGWLDVKMPKIVDEDLNVVFSDERYNIFPQKAHPTETAKFIEAAPSRCLKKSDPKTLEGYRLKDVTINHYTYAKPKPRKGIEDGKPIPWPRAYAVGFINKVPKVERFMTVWVRSTFKAAFPSENVEGDMLEQRKKCGLVHPGVPRILEIESELDSEADSDDEPF